MRFEIEDFANIFGRQLKDIVLFGLRERDLRQAGISLSDLVADGFTKEHFDKLGVNAFNLYRSAHLKRTELEYLGYTIQDVVACEINKRTFENMGYCLKDLITSGCSKDDFLDMGFTFDDFKYVQANFSRQDLRNLGVTLAELIEAGFVKEDFLHYGISAEDFIEEMYPEGDILKLGFTIKDLVAAGTTRRRIDAMHLTFQDLIDGGYFDSGYLDEVEGKQDLINDVTGESMRGEEVIIYRRNNRIYSILKEKV